MPLSAATRSLLAKALRMLLVFALVFWGTFRIELAVADDETGTEIGQPLPDGTVDEPGGEGSGTGAEGPDGSGDGTGGSNASTEQPGQPEQPADAPTFKKLSVHLYIDDPAGKTVPFANAAEPPVYSTEMRDDSIEQGQPPEISAVQGELTFMPVIEMTNGDRLNAGTHGPDAYDLVEWEVRSNADVADFVEAVAADGSRVKTGVLKATGARDGVVKVACKLKTDSATLGLLNLPAGSSVELEFDVNVIEQAGAYITSITVLGEDGNPLPTADTLKLDLDDGGGLSYQFSALITVEDPAKDANPGTYTLTTGDTSGLSDRDRELVESLTWSLADFDNAPIDEGRASIDQTGLFKASEKLMAVVTCSTSKGRNEGDAPVSIRVNTGIEAGLQGEYYPQPALTVTVQPAAAKSTADEADAEADENGNSPDSPEVEDGEGQIEASSEGDAPSSAAEDASELKRSYTVDDLSAFTWETATYALKGRDADAVDAAGADDNTTTVTGTGPRIADLLEATGADLDKVESVTFGSYGQEPVTVAWSQLASADADELAAILAVRSYVHVEGEDAPQESDLLDNTRFRLLYGNAALSQALPWVNSVTANGPQVEPEPESSLRASIGYIPVRKGSTAVLSASVVGLYSGEQFGYEWEESPDGGITWPSDASPETFTPYSADQTIRIPTTDETIGRTFRVIATTNQGRTAKSDPITITEGTGFSITLAYDPPLAGEMAFFTSSVDNLDRDAGESVVDYIWEWTEDGGLTWQEIAGSRGNPTFSTKTDPLDDSSNSVSGDDSADGSEGASDEAEQTPVPSIWIHVRALSSLGREATSNPVMLTVHVPDGDGSGETPTPTDQPQGTPDPAIPDENADPNNAQSQVPQPSAPTMREVSSITSETAPRTPVERQTPDGTQAAPTPQASSPTDLIVNPEVTAEIIQQQEAVNEVIESTRPGARWTALSTVDPDGQDVRRILSDNPFVPLTAPFALGLTAAGAVEKLLSFRRQTR